MRGARRRAVRGDMPQPSSRTAEDGVKTGLKGDDGEERYVAKSGVIFHRTGRCQRGTSCWALGMLGLGKKIRFVSVLTCAGRAACAGRREDRRGLVDREVPVREGERERRGLGVDEAQVRRGDLVGEEEEGF